MNDLERIRNLSPEQLELLMRETAGPPAGPPAVIPRRADPSLPAPLSFAQQRLWFLAQLDPGDPSYTMQGVFRLAGRVAPAALAAALRRVADRHEILRTRFRPSGGGGGTPVQEVLPAPPLDLTVADLRPLPPAAREHEWRRLAAELARQPFDLAARPPWRVLLARLAGGQAGEAIVAVAMHHAISDGWSLHLLIAETAAAMGGGPGAAALPELPIQFGDFAAWQRGVLDGEALAERLGFWRRLLAGAPAMLALPTDRPRPAAASWRGAAERCEMPAGLVRRLHALAAAEQATLYLALLAAYQVLLGRYAGQDDVLVGSPVAGRDQLETERLIGPFANTVVRRADLAGDPGFAALLRQLLAAALAVHAHADLPFEKLVMELRPERGAGHSPIFQVWFVFHNTPEPELALPDAVLRPEPIHAGTAKFDLTLALREEARGLTGTLEYRTALFEPATVHHMTRQLAALCAAAAAKPDLPVSRLPLLAAAEREQLLREGSGDDRPAAAPADLAPLFRAAPAGAAGAPAMICGPDELSWAELEIQVHRLANHLRGLGVGPGTAAGICLPRPLARLRSLLAVIAAGGVAVPLDPAHPAERLEVILEDAAVAVLITESDLVFRLPGAAAACELVCLDTDEAAVAAADTAPPPPVDPRHRAYLIYTSGSTGPPKGVAVGRGALAAHCAAVRRAFGLRPDDRVLQFAAPTFDVAFEQVFATLAAGATLVLRDGDAWSVRELEERIGRDGLSVVNLPTPFWQQWAGESAAGTAVPPAQDRLRLVIAGGDAMSPAAVGRWHASPRGAVRLLNAYGPTEAVITASLHEVTAAADTAARVPIGRPLAGRRLHLLDRHGELAAPGVPGEIHLADPLLAQGYLGRPDATAAAFVPDPYGPAGGRLYRSGDLGRRGASGEVEVLGRRDLQLKVRGFRVEPGEVEEALRRHRKVRDAVVVLRGGAAEERRLVAYVQPVRDDEVAGAAELREFVADTLPEPAVPALYVTLAALPRTSAGKVDRAALPDPAGEALAPGTAGRPPRTATEQVLATIWREVLGLTGLTAEDNFFDLGGHSLLGIQVVNRIALELDVDLPLQALFAAPTVAGLAERIEGAAGPDAARGGGTAPGGGGRARPPIESVARDGELPLSLAQQRLWLFERLEPGTPAYNVGTAVDLLGALDPAALRRSLAAVVERHESLRTTFRLAGDRPVQVIAAAAGTLALPVEDLSAVAPAERQAAAARRIAAEALRPFDLAAGPLLRPRLLRLGEREHVLLLNLHHIVCDGWSVGILVRELAALYAAFHAGRPSPLPPPRLQYADYAAWQRRHLSSAAFGGALGYWRGQLAGLPELDLPLDHPRPAAPAYRGAVQAFRLDAGLSARLRELARQEEATLFMLLLAAFAALLYRITGQDDFAVGTVVANRAHRDTEDLVGFFVNLLVLRTRIAGRDPSFREHLAAVRETALAAYAHQEVPFDLLVEELQPERQRSRNPLFQVLFVLQAGGVAPLRLGGLEVRPRRAGGASSHFDLMLEMVDGEEELHGTLQYDTDLFTAASAARLVAQLTTLLGEVAADPGGHLLALALAGDDAWETAPPPAAADPLAQLIAARFPFEGTR